MANTAGEARQIIDVCKQADVQLMIAYRCQFEVFKATRLVQSGELGHAHIIEATNSQSQGPGEQWRICARRSRSAARCRISDCNCLNGVRHVLGEEPVEVYAQVVNPRGNDRYKEVEETMAFMLRFPSARLPAARRKGSIEAVEEQRLSRSRISSCSKSITSLNASATANCPRRLGKKACTITC
ncbi:Myo-inositol 2-dehydrogenase [Candidatus Burkholderia pumila]|uniref:Myo-inositol 2-dehydrogenase n=1 Tax=Candidatus Burkholderia pumila TaxID=1090375 RepID=A0ABR5HP27_9BURK|nr:Myo-inositol 2-dehydrogenase [Candidatus Burkholderia pumila]